MLDFHESKNYEAAGIYGGGIDSTARKNERAETVRCNPLEGRPSKPCRSRKERRKEKAGSCSAIAFVRRPEAPRGKEVLQFDRDLSTPIFRRFFQKQHSTYPKPYRTIRLRDPGKVWRRSRFRNELSPYSVYRKDRVARPINGRTKTQRINGKERIRTRFGRTRADIVER